MKTKTVIRYYPWYSDQTLEEAIDGEGYRTPQGARAEAEDLVTEVSTGFNNKKLTFKILKLTSLLEQVS